MKVIYRLWLLALCSIGLFGALPAHAQTGSISGTVRSVEAGSPISSAVVQAVAPGGGIAASTLSDQRGRYLLVNLAPGSYTVVVTVTGFETQRTAGVQVTGGQAAVVNADLTSRAIDLDPIVVSASKRQEKALEAPARVEVITPQVIEQRPVITPSDHLRAVPGVDVAATGLQSSNVVARGFNNIFSGSLHMLTDNRLAGAPSLRVNLLHFIPATTEDMQRMEVVLGPGAALYGPNTANGILHIITKSPFDEQGTTVSVAGGEQSVLHTVFRTSQLLGENLGFKLSGQYLRGEEWPYVDPSEVSERQKFQSDLGFFRSELMRSAGLTQEQADARIARIGNRDNTVEKWSAEARADWRVTPDLTTIFSVGSNTQISGVELTGLGASQTQDWRSTYYQVRTNWNRLFAQAYLNTSDAGETYLLRNGAPIQDQSQLFVAQVQHGLGLGDRQNFTYGADYQLTTPRTNGTINGIYEEDDETREFGAYVQSETALSPKLDLVLAGRVDTHSALPDPVFSPRAALVLKPAVNQAFRVSFNRAFSTPSSLNQFLDLGSALPNTGSDPAARQLSQLGYSLRVQGTGSTGFQFRQNNGRYLARSPFTPAALGGPGTVLPANAATFFPLAVGVVAQGAAARGTPLNPALVAFLSSLRPTDAEVGLNYLNLVNRETGSLANLNLADVEPIRESISNTIEAGYKGILSSKLLFAADVWYSRRENLVTPLTIQTPLLLLNGPQVGAYLVPRLTQFFMAAGLPQAQAQAQATAVAGQLTPNLAQVPVGVITAENVNANGGQLLVTYTNVDETIDLWGSDISATALLTDVWSLSASASFVSDDQFQTESAGLVTLNAPKTKGSLALNYQNRGSGMNGEARVRYNAGFPVNSGVYVGTACLGIQGPLVEPCVDSFTLFDVTAGYRLPGVNGASIQLNVQNLLDEEYRAFPGAPFLGRMALLRLKYEF
jgi:outer membrane receptor for ferrienterochelin and colicins